MNHLPLPIQQANYTSREWRAVLKLLKAPTMREDLDKAIGASNSPHIVMCLRRKGLDIWCERLERIDRDGNTCRPGRYHLLALPEVTQ